MLLRYIFRRILQTFIVLICISIFAFSLIRLTEGNPARMMLPEDATDEQVHEMEVQLGLDKPLYVQYWMYISGVMRGDLGTSTTYKQPVAGIIAQRLPATGYLTLVTILVTLVVSIPLGIIAGSKQGCSPAFFAF